MPRTPASSPVAPVAPVAPVVPVAPDPSRVGDVRVEPRRFGALRLSLFRGVERTCALLGGRAFYRARHLAAGRFVEREECIRVPGLPPDLAGLTIAQLSDLHAGPFLARGDLRAVVDTVNARAPDLVVLTGDLIAHHWSEALLVADDLARLEAPLGRFAVFGNHDYRGRREGQIAAEYGGRAFPFLRNACRRIPVGGATLALVGLEDLEESHGVDLEAAREDLRPGDVEVVLCHNPRGAPAIARPGCALILSGHTHGTQVDLPWFRRLGPEHPGLRLDFGPTTLLVSRGLGVVGAPVRLGVPAEVVYATLERA